MGATKRVSELILQSLSFEQKVTKFVMVRFGNVLNSSGSVIPLFRQQIQNGGPVTVTHKQIIRYFMTIPEAVELVLQAGNLVNTGEVCILDMGKPVKIVDLARKMIKLSGFSEKTTKNPDGDIEIIYTGLRPGEKLFEELIIGSSSEKTNHQMIFKEKEPPIDWKKLEKDLKKLEKAADSYDHEGLRLELTNLVPEYSPRNKI